MLADQSTPRPIRILFAAVLIYAFFWVKGWPRTYDDDELPPSKQLRPEIPLGPYAVDRKQLIVSIITTAVNVHDKAAPLILNTPEEDHNQLLLFSDLQAEIGKWPVFDMVWRHSSDMIMGTKELGRYRTQIDFARRGVPMHTVKKQDAEEERKELAIMEKYKVLNTMAAAWEYRPDRSWYVFAGDETYINRPGLLDWLSQHDPKALHFFGNLPTYSATPIPDPFAAGGNAFIVSRKVMQELFDEREHLIRSWERKIVDFKSAFELVSFVLQAELELTVVSAWPGMSGFDPAKVPFSPILWCEPLLLMHHITPDIGSDLFKLEQEWAAENQTQMRFADLWFRFMAPENLNYTRSDWDNLSSEAANSRWNILFEGKQSDANRAKPGEQSAQACEASCENFRYCVQWSYSSIEQSNWNENPPSKCHLSSSIRLGGYAAPKEVDNNGQKSKLTWKSGWKKPKFSAWAKHQRCKEQHQ